jgi:hypothetical protein
MSRSTLILSRRRLLALFAAVACVALAFAVATRADSAAPIVDLGPVTVANGIATLSGHVTDQAMASSLTINGQPVAVDSSGQFLISVNLNGQSSLSFSTRDPVTGQTVTTTIPLSLAGAGGVIPGTVLDQLKAAGVSITTPTDGLVSLDGQPVKLSGMVRDPSQLQALTVNGKDVLDRLGTNGSFSQQVPGSSKAVTIQATDRQGVSQRETFSIESASSTVQTSQGTSVSAAGAFGIRIASVRYVLRGVQAKKRLSMIVTVKDRRGYLVRDAIVSVRGKSANSLRAGTAVKLSNKVGRATFVVRPRLARFGKRLFLIARAKTPSAQAHETTSVRLPKLQKRISRQAGSR